MVFKQLEGLLSNFRESQSDAECEIVEIDVEPSSDTSPADSSAVSTEDHNAHGEGLGLECITDPTRSDACTLSLSESSSTPSMSRPSSVSDHQDEDTEGAKGKCAPKYPRTTIGTDPEEGTATYLRFVIHDVF